MLHSSRDVEAVALQLPSYVRDLYPSLRRRADLVRQKLAEMENVIADSMGVDDA